ncbi:glutathione S-transferase family protein [Agrobacterium sp. S2]|nr:glutathione S-transferase family protein [Agrobacterium sp. S2]
MTIKIYNFAFGPYPQRLNIYLSEKKPPGIDLTIYKEPDHAANIPPAEIRALTPSGSLPILIDDNGTTIGQSLAILEYLEDTRGAPDMRGGTAHARAATRQFVNVFDEALTFFGLWARHGSQLGHGRVQTSKDIAQLCSKRYFDQLRLAERMIGDTPFIAGNQVTLADCVALATLQYADDFYGVPVPPECENLSKWYEAFTARPSAATPWYPESKRGRAYGLIEQSGVAVF